MESMDRMFSYFTDKDKALYPKNVRVHHKIVFGICQVFIFGSFVSKQKERKKKKIHILIEIYVINICHSPMSAPSIYFVLI